MSTEILFDITRDPVPWPVWAWLLAWLAGVIGGVIVLAAKAPGVGAQKKVFIALWLTVWVGIGGVSIANGFYQRHRGVRLLQEGRCDVVSGTVRMIKAMPYSGHSMEIIEIGGKRFAYSDYVLSGGGFRQTQSHGGPLIQGARVKIWFFRGRILKIERLPPDSKAAEK